MSSLTVSRFNLLPARLDIHRKFLWPTTASSADPVMAGYALNAVRSFVCFPFTETYFADVIKINITGNTVTCSLPSRLFRIADLYSQLVVCQGRTWYCWHFPSSGLF